MIVHPPKMFQVGKEYQLVCFAQGLQPPLKITWKLGSYNGASKVIAFDTRFQNSVMLSLIFLSNAKHTMN